MKKLFIVVAVLLAFCLTACDSSTDGDIQKPTEVITGEENVKPDTDTSAGKTEVEEANGAENAEATISEAVLVDEAGVKITAKSLDLDNLFGPELKLLIENNSGKDLTFQCRDVSVNGYMISDMMSVDVVNGKKANDGVTFMSSDLEECGITEIADIELSFYVFDADWEDYLETDLIQIKTSIADTYNYTFDDSGEVAYNADGIKIVVKGLKEDSILGPSIVVFVENTSGKSVTVQTRDVSINGFMVDPMFSTDVIVGKRAIDGITFLTNELEDNEITKIESTELSFHIFDSESWDTIADTDTVTINF